MSLINKMLRDLDHRRANNTIFKEFPAAISASQDNPPPKARPRAQALRLSAIVVAGALGWWALQSTDSRQPGPPSQGMAAPPPPAAPATPATVTVVEAPPALPEPPAAPVKPAGLPPPPAQAPVARPPEANAKEIRPAAPIKNTPPPREMAAKPAARDTAATAKTEKAAEHPAPTPPAQSLPATPVENNIQKTAVPISARERADGDIRRAQAYINAGQASEAMDLLRAALSADPSYPAPRQMLFKLLVDGKKPDAAISLLQDGLELLPQQIAWSMAVARLQVDRKDYAGAEKVLSKAAAYAVKSPDYFGFYGHVQQKLGDHKKAIETYQSAIRLNPAEGRWWMGLASALEAEKRLPEAREAYRQALETGSLNESLAGLAEKKILGQ